MYARASWRAEGNLERLVEPLAVVCTAAALLFMIVLAGRPSAVVAVTSLWARIGWDALHLGGGNVLEVDLPPDYPLYSMVVKGAASALLLLFAIPA